MAAAMSSSGIVTDIDEARLWISRSIRFLRAYRWLLDVYMIDFFVERLWCSAPRLWTEFLDRLSTIELVCILSDCDDAARPWLRCVPPLSLLAFRRCCHSLTLQRSPVSDVREVLCFLGKAGVDAGQIEGLFNCAGNMTWPDYISKEFINGSGHNLMLDHVMRKHVKPKKQHEIVRLGAVINCICRLRNIRRVQDVGSGQGHLSRYVAAAYGLTVECLEGDGFLVDRARKFDDDLKRSWLRRREYHNSTVLGANSDDGIIGLPKHTTKRLVISDAGAKAVDGRTNDDESKMLQSGFVPADSSVCLVGLHACGDLSALLVKEFATNDRIKALVSIGCCYMKLNGGNCDGTKSDVSERFGYPLSEFVKNCQDSILSYMARELSCHALEDYRKRLLDDDGESLRIHCYRATLEWLIIQKYPGRKHEGLRGAKRAHQLPFRDYVAKALSRSPDIAISVDDLDSNSAFIDDALGSWRRVVALYCLRVLIAPVVETVILLDRLMFVLEAGGSMEEDVCACLVPLFDPEASPRNTALIALKLQRR